MHQQTNLNTSIALYIHIPFCNTLCPYCGFYKVKNQLDLEAPLITALSQEIKYYHTQFKQIPLHSIFFGGGTPSLLSVPALSSLFEHIHTTFKLTADCEITMEMNPENITPTLLSAYKQLGINRLSIGIQSFNPKDLSFLGRTHTIKDIKKALTTVCTHDQWNYNIDLITGLPHLTLEQLNHSLEHALSFKPTHISPYTLSIEPNTPFKKHGITPLNQSIESTHYHHIHTKLTAAHYTHYEVSAFSKPGYDSQHNCTYWKYDPFIGIGPSANSFFENRRYSHPPSVLEYIKSPHPTFPDPLTQQTQIQEFLISNLRLKSGFKLSTFNQRFNQSFEKNYATRITKLQTQGLIKLTNNRCQTTKKGLFLLNELLLELI